MSWRSAIAYWKNRRLALIPHDTTPTPSITSSSTPVGVAGGARSVVITGINFMSVAPRPDAGMSFVENIWFGTTPATSFTVDSATQITAIGPASLLGIVSIVVNTSGGCATRLSEPFVTGYRITEASEYRLTEGGDRMLVN